MTKVEKNRLVYLLQVAIHSFLVIHPWSKKIVKDVSVCVKFPSLLYNLETYMSGALKVRPVKNEMDCKIPAARN